MYPLLQAVVYSKEPAGVGERENGNLMLPHTYAARRNRCISQTKMSTELITRHTDSTWNVPGNTVHRMFGNISPTCLIS
jgi:hypothetical protein